MPITERIVIDAHPSIKKMLSEISKEYEITMKEVVCSLIESKYKELQLRKQRKKSEHLLNLNPEDLKTKLN